MEAGPSTLPANTTSRIANPAVRSAALRRHRQVKTQAKLSRRLEQRKAERLDPALREARLAQNVPRTIERTREWLGDGTEDARTRPVAVEVIPPAAEGEDEDVRLDLGALSTLFASYPVPDPDQPPPHNKVLVTTSPRPSTLTLAFLDEFKSMLGGGRHVETRPRRNAQVELGKVCRWAAKRDFGALIVVAEDKCGRNRSGPTHLTISRLPYGPTAHFRLTSLMPGKAISHHGRPTAHFPELVLSNFSTPLGLSVGTLLQSMFPPLPELAGRQVVSLQNQRDFVFVRRWRYAFATRDKELLKPGDEAFRTKLQELGPRFTLKLRWLKRGTLNGRANEDVTADGHESRSAEGLEQEKEAQREGSRRGRQKLRPDRASEDDERKEEAEAAKEAGVELDAPVLDEAPPKKKRKRKPTSAGVQEAFLRGDGVASDDEARPGGGLDEYMKGVEDRVHGRPGAKKKRDVEWEWKPRMGVSRRSFFL